MNHTPLQLCEEQIEERLLQALTWDDVLPYADLKTRAAASIDDSTFHRILNDLIAAGLVQRKAARRSLWYLGYAKVPSNSATSLDDVPAPFRKFLSELAW
jgi:DNA-binding IclR family transcriptional regulator